MEKKNREITHPKKNFPRQKWSINFLRNFSFQRLISNWWHRKKELKLRPTLDASETSKNFLLNQFLSRKNPENSLKTAKKIGTISPVPLRPLHPLPGPANQNLFPLLTPECTDRPLGDLCNGHGPSDWAHAGRGLVDRTTRRGWSINSRKL